MENIWLNDHEVNPKWLAASLGILEDKNTKNILRVTAVEDCSNAGRIGLTTKQGTTIRITVVVQSTQGQNRSFILKQVPQERWAFSKQLGLAREALFYKHLAGRVQEGEKAGVPHAYFSSGNMDTGEKFVLMQDLSNEWVDSGIFFGPGNPNNWKRDLVQMIDSQFVSKGIAVPSAAQVAKTTFIAMARVHASFWNRKDLLLLPDYNWLRGQEWIQGLGRESWEASQAYIRHAWKKIVLEKEEKGITLIEWDPIVRETVEKAIDNISWESQLKRLHATGTDSTHWTLVHGDFWPGNVMWKVASCSDGLDHSIKLLDWEMVGLGSGPQDLGQYVLSNMDPIVRRDCESDPIQAYYHELSRLGVANVTFDYCWNEYKIGGLERWLWFLVYFLAQEGDLLKWAQFFHNQISSFMCDHGLNHSSVVQPRP